MGRLALATDYSERSDRALRRAVLLARRDLKACAAGIGAAGAECLVRHETTAAAVEILEEAVARRACLLVVSSQSRTTLARAVLGSVAERETEE